MSSYHSSFSYLGKNSKTDFNWIIAHFSDNADSGETDTFLSTSAIYSDSYDGTRQTFYGAKYDTVATPQITVIKQDGTDFGIDDNRKALRWLTGSRQATWMDFYIGDEVKYRLLGRVKSVSQYKMDARVVGLILTFESVSPYGYSSVQTIETNVSGSKTITIPCDSDDLYSYVYMNIAYTNTSGSSLTITNNTIGDAPTKVTGLVVGETLTMSDNMVITSDKPSKTFGDTFNFNFPRLAAGDNKLTIEGTGHVTFQYITPVKLGDIAIDVNAVSDPICDSDGEIQIDMLDWSRISNTPKTLVGYGITDSYTKAEVDAKIANATITNVYTKKEIDSMLDEFVSDDVYTKSEVDQKLQEVNTTLENEYFKSTYIEDKYYDKKEIDDIVSQLSYDPETGTSATVSWSQITDKPTDLAGYGVKTEVQEMIDARIAASSIDINEDELNTMLTEVLGE